LQVCQYNNLLIQFTQKYKCFAILIYSGILLYMSLLIIFIILVFLMYPCYEFICIKKNEHMKNENIDNSHIHSNDDYPEMKFIFENRNIIIKEFYENVLDGEGWSNWMEYDKISNTPIFSKMSRNQIIKRMKDNNCKINVGNPSWKIFGLILYGGDIGGNIQLCPNTMRLLRKCRGIVNAGFSCLEPGVITALHHDFNHKILRCHIPIIIPKGNTAIQINNNKYKWHNNKYFIFDDTYDHQAWNYTNEIRVVLIIDIKKS